MGKKAGFIALVPIIYFAVSGGPYGLEEIVSSVGPFFTLLLIVLVPILWTIPETMIVAELSSTYPVQGGYYKWVQMGLGNFWGFMEGWWSILYNLIDLSLYPILFTTYLKLLFPTLDFWTIYLIQLSLIWICVFLNILGIRIVGNVLAGLQAFIVLIFLYFVLSSAFHVNFDFKSVLRMPEEISLSTLAFALSLGFWNYIGFDGGSTVLGEIHNPSKNYYKAMFLTILIIVAVYFFPILAGVCIQPDWQNWTFGEFTKIANLMGSPILGILLAAGGMVFTCGLFNSLILTSTRVISTMAQDGWLPNVFGKIHKKYDTPHITILLAGMVYSLLVLVGFHKLIVFDVFLFLIAMFLEAVTLIVLRNKNPQAESNFKIPFGKVGMYFVVGLASFMILLMSVIFFFELKSSPLSFVVSLTLVLSGIPIYLLILLRRKSISLVALYTKQKVGVPVQETKN